MFNVYLPHNNYKVVLKKFNKSISNRNNMKKMSMKKTRVKGTTTIPKNSVFNKRVSH